MFSRRRPPMLLALLALLSLTLGSFPAHAQQPQDLTRFDRSRPAPDEGPTKITVSVLLVDLIEIVDAQQAFVADIGVIAEWHDSRLAGRWDADQVFDVGDVWDPRLQVVNQHDVQRSLPETVEVRPDGTVTYRQRFTGSFRARLDLRDFPLDHQEFHVHIVTVGHTPDQVELMPNADASGSTGQVSVSDWAIGSVGLEPLNLVTQVGVRELSGVALVVEATREVRYYVVQLLLPLIAIVIMSWTAFWIDPTVVAPRMSVVVTTMLTLIAYRFALGTLVPKLAYLTRLDWFMLGATLLVLFALLSVAATSYLVSKERRGLVARIDRLSRLCFPAAFVVLMVVVWLA